MYEGSPAKRFTFFGRVQLYRFSWRRSNLTCGVMKISSPRVSERYEKCHRKQKRISVGSDRLLNRQSVFTAHYEIDVKPMFVCLCKNS